MNNLLTTSTKVAYLSHHQNRMPKKTRAKSPPTLNDKMDAHNRGQKSWSSKPDVSFTPMILACGSILKSECGSSGRRVPACRTDAWASGPWWHKTPIPRLRNGRSPAGLPMASCWISRPFWTAAIGYYQLAYGVTIPTFQMSSSTPRNSPPTRPQCWRMTSARNVGRTSTAPQIKERPFRWEHSYLSRIWRSRLNHRVHADTWHTRGESDTRWHHWNRWTTPPDRIAHLLQSDWKDLLQFFAVDGPKWMALGLNFWHAIVEA